MRITSTRYGSRGVLVAFAILASSFAALAASAAPSVASAVPGTAIPVSVPQGMVLDPVSGRVFVVGGDKVAAFDASGALVGTVEDVYGAYGIALAGGYLWAPQTSAGTVVKIDPVTLAKVAEFPAGGTLDTPIAAVGGQVYFVRHAPATTTYTLVRLDPASGVRTPLIEVGSGAMTQFQRISETPARLLVGDTIYDVSGATPTLVVSFLPYRQPIAGTSDGQLVTATTSPQPRIEERRIAAPYVEPTGAVYPAEYAVNALDYSEAKGGVIAASTRSGQHLFVFQRGNPSATHTFGLGADGSERGVVLSPDGSRVYVITSGAEYGFHLQVFSLAPTFASASTTTLYASQATSKISGTGLGAITSAQIGGQKVVIGHDGPDSLEIEVPVLPAPGSWKLRLIGPFGNLEIPFTTQQARTNSVRGTVTENGAPVAGATVSLRSPASSTTAVTTAADGTYEIPSAIGGLDNDLTVVKGGDRRVLSGRALSGAGPWRFDVDLRSAAGASPVVRRIDLPPGEVRRLIVDPGTGRVYVAVGDEVVVFGGDGRRIARIQGLPSADDLQIVGTTLYVMLRNRGTIAAVDLTSATYALSNWLPVQGLSTGSFAVVGNRVVFADGDDQTRALASVDLTTRTVRHEVDDAGATPLLGPVVGAPNRLMTWERGGSSQDVIQWSASSSTLTKESEIGFGSIQYTDLDVIASAPEDRAWTSDGREWVLSTMAPTGVTYPADVSGNRSVPALARSAGHGGVLAFGAVIVRQGAPTATHSLPFAPAHRSVGLSADADRAYSAGGGQFVVTDLRPVITSITPDPVPDGTTSLTVSGSGMGGVTGVLIDGGSATFTKLYEDRIGVTLPVLADGLHELAVTTAWGTSSPVSFRTGPAPADPDPFPTWAALVTRVHTDLTGRAPTPAFRDQWAGLLAGGTETPGDLAETLRRGTDNTANVDPVARLYRAFLGRTPDASGLTFWVKRKRAGTWSVTKMADSFAASSEFKTKYGTLSNRQFVTRIYTDVLGRAADKAGVDFWTGRLDRRVSSRGQVMVGFSESSEYRRKQAENTDAAVAFIFLLGRAPTSAELGSWTTRQKAGTTNATLVGELLASEAYATHIAG